MTPTRKLSPPSSGVFHLATVLLAIVAISSGHAQTYSQLFAGTPSGWVVGGGTWSANGTYNQTDYAPSLAYSTYSTTTWTTNFTLTADVYVGAQGGAQGNRIGLIYNWVSATDFYYVSLSTAPVGTPAPFELHHYTGTYPGALVGATTVQTAPVGGWFTLKVIRTGNTTTIQLNGANVTNMTNLSQTLSAGRIGVIANFDGAAKFDNLYVDVPEVKLSRNGTEIADNAAAGGNTDFGNVDIAGGPVTRTFTIENTHTGLDGSPLTIGTITRVSGSTDFTFTQPGSTTLAPGATTTFNIMFDPSSTGAKTAKLSFSNNDANENPYDINLAGSGIIVPDTTPPTVSISSPLDGASVQGTINVNATASDNVGVVGVQFKLDGVNLGTEDTASPWSVSWNTTSGGNVQHVLMATARDAAGNLGNTASGVLVTVNNGDPLLPPWKSDDVGSPGRSGTANYTQLTGIFSIAGGGSGIFNTSDKFQFVHEPMTTDCAIIARVQSIQDLTTRDFEHAGVMFRESLAANSAYVGLYLTRTHGILFEARSTTGGSAFKVNPDIAGPVLPTWIKLIRTGNVFTGYYSSDGAAWTKIPQTGTIAMAATVEAGLAVTGEDDNATCLATFDKVTVQGSKPTFPKIGGILYGEASYNDTIYRAAVAKHHLAVMNFWRNWGGSPAAIQAVVDAIKRLNPSTLVGNYTNVMQSQTSSAAAQDVIDKLTGSTGPTGNGGTWAPNDWWARDHTGAILGLSAFPDTKNTNLTQFVTPDANNERFPQWYAGRVMNVYFNPVPEFDFIYSDNAFARPKVTADWNRDGVDDTVVDQNSFASVEWRKGMAAYFDSLYARRPGVLIMPNYEGTVNSGMGHAQEAEYNQKTKMALYETAMGANWSEETCWSNPKPPATPVQQTWGGFYKMLQSYRTLMANTAAPHFVLVNISATVDGKCSFAPAQSTYGGGAPYAFARYGLATMLLDDGYFCIENSYGSATPLWLDEFDLQGTADTNWLGAAIDPPPAIAYQNGVFRRRFEHGMAIVNPRHNSDMTARTDVQITIEDGYARIGGATAQDPTINNGQNVGTAPFTIRRGDGLILRKL